MALSRRSYMLSYLFLLPTLVFIGTFMYNPILSAFYHSFTKWNLATTEWVGLDNFRLLFHDSVMGLGALHQLIFTSTDVLKSIVMPLLAAELVHLLQSSRMKYLFRTGFVLQLVVPGMVGTLLWLSIYNPTYGLLNQFLTAIGQEEWTRAWLAESDSALISVVMAGFPFVSAISFLIFYAAIANLSSEVLEAARIDGATGRHVFAKLHLPLLVPQFKVIVILTIIGSLQDFVKIIVLTNGGPGTATVIPSYLMYSTAFASSRYGYASAIGTGLFIVILGLTLLNMKLFKTRE